MRLNSVFLIVMFSGDKFKLKKKIFFSQFLKTSNETRKEQVDPFMKQPHKFPRVLDVIK